MCTEKEKHELDRRSFLKRMMTGGMVVASNPLHIMLANYLSHFMSNGLANAAGQTPFNDAMLINLGMEQGPSRWFWDYAITPNGAKDPRMPNEMVINALTAGAGGKTIGEYKTTTIGNYQMPYLWASLIPTADGGTVPMSKLAANFLNLRGLLDSDGHVSGQKRMMAPNNNYSLTGMVCDAATSPIPAINYGGYNEFKSPKGKSETKAQNNGRDPLTNLTAAFAPLNGSIANMTSLSSSAVESKIDAVLDIMKGQSSDKLKFLPVTYDDRLNAKNLLKTSFGNLASVYATLQSKYALLIKRALTDSMVSLRGLDDISLPGDSTGKDIRFKLGDNGLIYSGADLQSLVNANTYIGGLAESMAVAEFMATNKLTSSINLMIGNMYNAAIDAMVPFGGGSVSSIPKFGINNDTHYLGAYPSLIKESNYFKAIAACLYELIEQLKKANLWTPTTPIGITITGDFNRAAHTDGSGADHGFAGSCFTVFSPRIPGPLLLGNTKSDKTGGYAGSWGVGAPVAEFNNRIAGPGNAVSTVAEILGVKSPVPNDSPFLTYKNGKITLIVPDAKVIS